MEPLFGDSEGRYKVYITGNSGTGKSTTGVALAALLGVPYISLDQLYWEPGWKESSLEEFQAKIRESMSQGNKGWVIDGNYTQKGGQMVLEESTDVIWLDPPLMLYFPCILVRTIYRLFGLRPTCSPGCPETFRGVFLSKTSILWWCLTNHWASRHQGQARMLEIGINPRQKEPGRKMRRFGGWGSELREWMKEVKEMCLKRSKTV